MDIFGYRRVNNVIAYDKCRVQPATPSPFVSRVAYVQAPIVGLIGSSSMLLVLYSGLANLYPILADSWVDLDYFAAS